VSASIESVTSLAKAVAASIPAAPHALRDDEPLRRAWENVMLEAAHGIAAAIGHDRDLLAACIGPPIEVGANAAWRALLEVALIVSTPAVESRASAVPLRLASSVR
jgi:hypothetical protein